MADPAYKLMEIAAAGTFGTVCIAHDLHRGKLVALKVLKQAHLHRPRVIARARDEAAMLSRLDHPNIVEVEGLIHIGERPVVVMEWVRGMSLEDVVRACPGGFPPGVAVQLICDAAEALQAAYDTSPPNSGQTMRIIHRDIKPSNMLLSVEGTLKLVDFGIARAEFEGKESKTLSMVLGARGYLAPERLDGHDDQPSVDIYSLGICLYEFLTGRHVVLSVHDAFHAEAMDKALARLRPEGLTNEAREELCRIIRAMCSYHEGDRPDHATVIADLRGLLALGNLTSDLPAFSQDKVLHLFRERKVTRPIDHPGYPDLAFLDRTKVNCIMAAPPDVNERLSDLFEQADWDTDPSVIDLLLVQNPHWTVEPFLDALPDSIRPWWRFWDAEPQSTPSQLCLLLQYIGRVPLTEEIHRRILPLREHPDDSVQIAVGTLLAKE